MKNKHLILFDSSCALCRSSVDFLKKIDRGKKLQFAPLSGKVARAALPKNKAHLLHANTLVLLEGYPSPRPRIWIRGRAVMRILWLIGGRWRLLGWLYIMPFIDFFYRIAARHRHLL